MALPKPPFEYLPMIALSIEKNNGERRIVYRRKTENITESNEKDLNCVTKIV
tara:strand:+ start:4637 stop:4792 length:156 start_codon:yes stop_codon:yes gene_type:complete